jgi:type II secretory pathway pseudopilin PulG
VTPPPVAYARVQVPAAMQAVGNSLRPMSFDLGNDDLDDVPFQRKSRKGWVVAVLGLAAAAGVAGFFSTRQRSGGDDIATVAAAAAMAAPRSYAASPLPASPPPQPTPYVTPPPSTGTTAQASAPAEASPLNPQFTDRFNETTKQKLLDADKARDEKAKARHAAVGSYRPSHSSKSSGVFTSGGNKYDPLNSNL